MELQQFDFHGHGIRVVGTEQDPMFVLNDVAKVLGIKNIGVLVSRLDKADICRTDVRSGGQIRNMVTVNESALYEVVIRSDKPEARAFSRWVTHEVLPAIRRHGAYMTEETIEKVLTDPDTIIKLATELKNERAKVAELQPAANSWNYLAAPGGDYGVAGAAKVLSRDPNINIGRNKLFEFMAGIKWIFRTTGRRAHWEAYQDKAINTGRLSHKLSSPFLNEKTGEWEQPAPTIRITPKGLHELHQLLGGSDQTSLVAI